MRTILATLFCVVVSGTPAAAHFVFLLPPTDGKSVTGVFADRPSVENTGETGKISTPTVRLVSLSGKTTTASLDPVTGGWRIPIGNDTAAVRATVEYGVVNRGEGNLIRIRHHAHLLLGERAEENADERPEFALTPVAVTAGLAFRVTFAGKPVAGADVTVYEPGSDQLKVLKTDTDGRTPGFAKPGRYSARAMHIDNTPGEFEGRKYAVTHSYATATATVK